MTPFVAEWDDIQVEPRDPAANIPYITNGGAAQVIGLEWPVVQLIAESFKINVTGTYLGRHELTDDQPVLVGASPAVISGKDGDQIPNTADLQFYTAIKYITPIADRNLTLVVDITYRDKINSEFRKNSPFNLVYDSYTVMNLMII